MFVKSFQYLICSASFFLITADALATNLDCQIINNGSVVKKASVQVAPGQRVKVEEIDGVVAYVAEKELEIFEVEAFIAGAEARLYASGGISDDRPLVATLWSRDQLISVECRR